MSLPVATSITTKLTVDDRILGDNPEYQERFVDGAAYIQGVVEVIDLPGEVTLTFDDTLPGDAKKRLTRFVKGLKR